MERRALLCEFVSGVIRPRRAMLCAPSRVRIYLHPAPAIQRNPPPPSGWLAFRARLPDTGNVQVTVTQLTDQLVASYAQVGGINHLDGKNLPSKRTIGH